MALVLQNVLQAIGGCKVAKLCSAGRILRPFRGNASQGEHLNPGFSKKDRVGLHMILEAAGVPPLLLICLMNMLHRFKPIDFSNAKPRSF